MCRLPLRRHQRLPRLAVRAPTSHQWSLLLLLLLVTRRLPHCLLLPVLVALAPLAAAQPPLLGAVGQAAGSLGCERQCWQAAQ